jgi:hypothetical protein
MAGARRPGRGRQALAFPVVAVIAVLSGCMVPGEQQSQVRGTRDGTFSHGAAVSPPQGAQPGPALARLRGLTGSELRVALGDPALTHRDGPAQLWQYDGRDCVLEVFFYEDKGAFRVSYAEILADSPAMAGSSICVDRLARGAAQADAAQSVAEAAPSPTP